MDVGLVIILIGIGLCYPPIAIAILLLASAKIGLFPLIFYLFFIAIFMAFCRKGEGNDKQ